MSNNTLADKYLEHVKQIDDKLFGLTDYHIKILKYFIKDILGLKYCKINIDTNQKLIIIQPTDHTGKNVKISVGKKHKQRVANFLSKKLNVNGKVIFK